MIISTDIIFKTDKRYLFDELKNSGVFINFIQLLIFAISIGIHDDKIENVKGKEKVEIFRNTLQNYNTNRSLDFLFKTAIITSKHIPKEFDQKTKLRLAFDDNFNVKDFNRIDFLLKFAVFGLSKIEKEVFSDTAENAIDNLIVYIEDMFASDSIDDKFIEDILKEEMGDFNES